MIASAWTGGMSSTPTQIGASAAADKRAASSGGKPGSGTLTATPGASSSSGSCANSGLRRSNSTNGLA